MKNGIINIIKNREPISQTATGLHSSVHLMNGGQRTESPSLSCDLWETTKVDKAGS